jgi:hypothetical protein
MQAIGMPFIMTQQVMPGIIMPVMQSQQDWIIFSKCLSPLVHVIVHPMSIISTLHIPIIPTLHTHMVIPFIIMQHEHMPFCIIIMRLAIIAAEVLSSNVQVIRMPPGHFSMAMVHRGAIIMPGVLGVIIPGIIIPPMPPIMGMFIIPPPPIGMDIPLVIPRSVIIPVVMANSSTGGPSGPDHGFVARPARASGGAVVPSQKASTTPSRIIAQPSGQTGAQNRS